jgi:hypothetical protein
VSLVRAGLTLSMRGGRLADEGVQLAEPSLEQPPLGLVVYERA